MKDLVFAAITYFTTITVIGVVIGATFWFIDPNRKN